MALLDVRVWLEEKEKTYQDGRETENKERKQYCKENKENEHHRKEIASKIVI